MSGLLDLYGFLSVLLRVFALVAQSVFLGSVAFLVFGVPAAASPALERAALRTLRMSAWTLACVAIAATGLNAEILSATLDMPFGEMLSARFAVAGVVKALAAMAAAFVAVGGGSRLRTAALVLLAVIAFGAALVTTHAAARPVLDAGLLAATALHQVGAAVWLGGLPCFYQGLRIVGDDAHTRARLGRRYSALSIAGVALIVAGALVLAVELIGSWPSFYGTPYGAMAAGKVLLLALLLGLGAANFLAVRRFARRDEALARVRRFVEVEIALGLAVLALAASMTSAPPAIDLGDDRITLEALLERMTPKPPRLETPDASALAIATLQRRLDAQTVHSHAATRPRAFVPGSGELPPRNAQDLAWSEYNHHWAGLIVLLMGALALLERTGRTPWARHWPLAFLGLAAFILLRADPEVWPTGHIGLLESLRDPEVVQHRIFALMAAAFGWFEWRVRIGRIHARRAAYVLPVLMMAGGILLLAHTHALSEVKDQVLTEWSHLPLGVLGVVGGAARWLELRASAAEARWAAWLWPVCLVLTGCVLLNYREA